MHPGSFKSFSAIAYQCVKKDREERPTMAEIVEELEFSLKQQEIFENNTPESSYRERSGSMLTRLKGQSQDNDHCLEFESRSVSLQGQAYDGYSQKPSLGDIFRNDSYDTQGDSQLECGPGIDGLRIIGEAKPGYKLLTCGFPVRGTSLCMFQWVRFEEGEKRYIDGATNPEYLVTADDVDKLVAVECIPMDDAGRQGEIVRLFANDQNKITCDPEMQQEIDNYISVGQASFSVVLMHSKSLKLATLSLTRFKYQIIINNPRVIFRDETYSWDSIKIPSGRSTECTLRFRDYSSHTFSFHDYRTRDTFVLTMRKFQSKIFHSEEE